MSGYARWQEAKGDATELQRLFAKAKDERERKLSVAEGKALIRQFAPLVAEVVRSKLDLAVACAAQFRSNMFVW